MGRLFKQYPFCVILGLVETYFRRVHRVDKRINAYFENIIEPKNEQVSREIHTIKKAPI